MELNHTHDVTRRSWVDTANEAGTDFPLQNLPLGIFRRAGRDEPWRGGVAIGNQIVDLAALQQAGVLDGLAADAVRTATATTLNALLDMGPAAWQALRHALFALLEAGSPHEKTVRHMLVPQTEAEHAVPVRIGDYTDFYTSLDHALNCSRPLGMAISPNFDWLPIAYHGRVSSIDVSGQQVYRPVGQYRPDPSSAPVRGACRQLDYELEVGAVIGTGNSRGTAIPLADAQQHLFGLCLLNDWSARDIQAWEMQPLGPFLAKNFATTLSPWLVTVEALLPYRTTWSRVADRPQPLDYLQPAGRRVRYPARGVDPQRAAARARAATAYVDAHQFPTPILDARANDRASHDGRLQSPERRPARQRHRFGTVAGRSRRVDRTHVGGNTPGGHRQRRSTRVPRGRRYRDLSWLVRA